MLDDVAVVEYTWPSSVSVHTWPEIGVPVRSTVTPCAVTTPTVIFGVSAATLGVTVP